MIPSFVKIGLFFTILFLYLLFFATTVSAYQVVSDFDTWTFLHDYYNVSGTPQTTAGFTLFPANEIFLWSDTDALSHEYEHVECNENSTNLMDRHTCNQQIDTQDIMKQSTREIHKTPEPPKMTGKLMDSIYGRIIS